MPQAGGPGVTPPGTGQPGVAGAGAAGTGTPSLGGAGLSGLPATAWLPGGSSASGGIGLPSAGGGSTPNTTNGGSTSTNAGGAAPKLATGATQRAAVAQGKRMDGSISIGLGGRPNDPLAGGGGIVAAKGFQFSGLVGWYIPTMYTGFPVTIYWGDGTASVATVVSSGGVNYVYGTHTYAEDGIWPATLWVPDTNPTYPGGFAVVVYALVLALQDDTLPQTASLVSLTWDATTSQGGFDNNLSFSLNLSGTLSWDVEWSLTAIGTSDNTNLDWGEREASGRPGTGIGTSDSTSLVGTINLSALEMGYDGGGISLTGWNNYADGADSASGTTFSDDLDHYASGTTSATDSLIYYGSSLDPGFQYFWGSTTGRSLTVQTQGNSDAGPFATSASTSIYSIVNEGGFFQSSFHNTTYDNVTGSATESGIDNGQTYTATFGDVTNSSLIAENGTGILGGSFTASTIDGPAGADVTSTTVGTDVSGSSSFWLNNADGWATSVQGTLTTGTLQRHHGRPALLGRHRRRHRGDSGVVVGAGPCR